MNKADLERALKKTVGAALKPVYVRDIATGNEFAVLSVTYDAEANVVQINANIAPRYVADGAS